MKSLLSTRYSAGAFNTAMLLLRIVMGGLLLKHGYDKMVDFPGAVDKMISLFGMSKTVCTVLVIFAEFFCSLLVMIGLFTRLASIPVIITMIVALWKVHNFHFISDGQMATLFLGGFLVLLFVGPGKVAVDSMIGK
jgi:putative oxidoreductase